ncbi:MAG: hypothetical protein IJW99_05360 [Clostridia bacterium]|nr:hypothetical protein [Clostridia bacterium]
MSERSVYILLTRTSSVLSRLIHRMTRAAYTHAALVMDEDFEEIYSFTRRDPRYILPAGLAREDLRRGLYRARKDPPCRVYRLRLTEEEYGRIRARVQAMYARRERYGYNFLGVAANYFGYRYTAPRRYFCSEFVATMVREGGHETAMVPARMRPMDFAAMPELEQVYQGSVSGLRRRVAARRAKKDVIWGKAETLPPRKKKRGK